MQGEETQHVEWRIYTTSAIAFAQLWNFVGTTLKRFVGANGLVNDVLAKSQPPLGDFSVLFPSEPKPRGFPKDASHKISRPLLPPPPGAPAAEGPQSLECGAGDRDLSDAPSGSFWTSVGARVKTWYILVPEMAGPGG